MNQALKKSIALLLVVLQLFVLLPAAALPALAAKSETKAAPETPVLNETIIGTVQFGSFNYLSGSNGKEAADYVMPFVYTDDYFAASAIQPNVTGKEMNWDKLENKSLATASMDFTMACFGSNEEITNVTDYETDYDKNGVQFLQKCRFENIETNNYDYDGSNPLTKENKYNKFPSKDSVGVIIGSKQIKVWNPDTQNNETYTLVAVGVRGAGYGAEWASNLTLGASGEHQGFREGANKVEYKLDDYLNQRGITASQNVKFWVCGYSRAGAIASLVAGDLSSKSKYNVAKKNVYGYTFESAAGADATVDPNGTVYPNIHNIINKMDAVPRVSAQFFGNNRYGVDYIVPNYSNAAANSLNANYYNRMYKILQTIATGYFDSDGNAQEDPAVTNAKPGTYPVDGTIQVHQFEIKSALNGSYGAVPYTGRWGNQPSGHDIGTKSGSNYYIKIDAYLDSLVSMMFNSKAWDYNPRNASATITNTNALTHRQKYATLQNGASESYQDAMRDLVGIALGTPGARLAAMFDGIIGSILGDFLNATELLLSITGDPTGFFYKGYDQRPTDEYAEYTSNHMKSLLYNVLKNKSPFSENRTTTQTAINALSPVLTRLFLYDRSGYGSQYLGTLLKYALGTILVTHTPGLDVSWQMAMDDNYTSDYREITFPIDADVKVYTFREGVDDTFTATGILDTTSNTVYDNGDAAGALVAEMQNAAFVPVQDPLGNDRDTLDQRISVKADGSGTLQVIRYPANLDLRFDAKNASAKKVSTASALAFKPQDATATCMKATYTRAANGNINQDSVQLEQLVGSYDSTVASALTNKTANCNVEMNAGDTLRVFTYAATNRLEQNASKSGGFDIFLDKKPYATLVDYASTDGMTTGTSSSPLLLGVVETSEATKEVQNGLRIRSTVSTVPASSVYFDDDFADSSLSGTPGDSIFSTVSEMIDSSDGTKQYWYEFTGSRIDVYCTTFNKEGEGDSAKESGYVQAKIVDAEGNMVPGKITTIKNASETTRYNVPTISFDGLTPGTTYCLVLNVLKNANYRLDGIRVYNLGTAAVENPVTFANLREVLLGASTVAGITDKTTGAAFYVDGGDEHVMALTNADYVANSPKNELYLSRGQSVAFQINGAYDSVAVGLSAPDNEGSATVTVTDGESTKTETISSVVDTYYTIRPNEQGYVSIENNSDVLVSVTNVRIEGFEPARLAMTNEAPALVVSPGLKLYAASFRSIAPAAAEPEEPVVPEETTVPEEPVIPEETAIPEESAIPEETAVPEETAAPVETAAPEETAAPVETAAPEETPTPEPTPTPDPFSMLSQFLNSLFRSFSRLFGRP